MNLFKLQDSTSNATSNVNIRSKAKFFSLLLFITAVALTLFQIASATLLMHLPFNETAGTIAGDIIGTHNGTIYNTHLWYPGMSWAAYYFDETTDYVQIPDFNYGPEFTIAYRFKTDSNLWTSYKYMYSHGNESTTNSLNTRIYEWGRSITPGRLSTIVRDNNDNRSVNIDQRFDDNKRHYYSITVNDTDDINIYIDWKNLWSSSVTRWTFDPTTDIFLWARRDLRSDRFFKWYLDDIRIYSGSLSSGEITTLYQTFTSNATNPILTGFSPTGTWIHIEEDLKLIFDENITAITGKNIIIKQKSDDTTFQTIDTTSTWISIDNNIITVNISWTLQKLTEYYVLIDSGAFIDIDWNSYTGITNIGTREFKTNNWPTPVMHLKLDETSGTWAIDSSIENNTGTNNWAVINQPGIDWKAYYFAWNNGVVTIPDFDYGEDFTVSMRFKTNPDLMSNADYIFSHWVTTDTNNLNFNLYSEGTSNRVYARINDDDQRTNITKATYDNTRHLYTVSVDDDWASIWKKQRKIYIDWVLQATDTDVIAWDFNPTTDILLWQRNWNTNSDYKGYLDDIRIYSETLTDLEIQNIYNDFTNNDSNPTLIENFPINNNTWIYIEDDLKLIFDENITAITGKNIVIKQKANDAIFQTIDVTNSWITIDNYTVSVSLSWEFNKLTEYYVLVDSGAFIDIDWNSYTGITDTNTRNFTTNNWPVPLLHLKLDETSGTWAIDSSIENHTGTNNWAVINQPGIDWKAYYFAWNNGVVTIPDFDYWEDFTVSMWIKTNTWFMTNSDYIFSHGWTNDTNNINLYLYSENPYNRVNSRINNNTNTLNDLTQIYDNTRHLYTITIDNNWEVLSRKQRKVYIDWILQQTDTSLNASEFNPTTDILLWQRNWSSNSDYKWYLDDVRIYNKTLTKIEVQEIYDEFTSNDSPPTITSTDPANNQTWVSTDSNLTITFDENITAVNFKSLFIKKASDNTVFEEILLSDTNIVNIDNNIVTINPSNTFEANTWYYILIDDWAFKDSDDTLFTWITSSTTRNFETNSWPQPVMYLKFDETSGTTALDSSDSWTHTWFINWASINQSGVDWKAYYLDGVNDRIEIADFDYGPEFTILFWIKKDGAWQNNEEYIFNHWAYSDIYATNISYTNSSNRLYNRFNNSHNYFTDGWNLVNNKRHHYSFSVDNWQETLNKRTRKVYIDGNLKYTNNTLDSGIYNPDDDMRIWWRLWSSTRFTEAILDEVRIYNSTLSQEQIQTIYQEFAPPEIITTNPTNNQTWVLVNQTIEILFNKEMNRTSVENNFEISPNVWWLTYSNDNNKFIINHDSFGYLTWYTVTIFSGAEDINWTNIDDDYVFSFETSEKSPLLMHLKLDEIVGTIADDDVSIHTWQIFGAMNIWQTWVDGNAYLFDEVDDYIEIQDFDYGDTFSLSYRFKIENNDGNQAKYLYSHGVWDNSINNYLFEHNYWSSYKDRFNTAIQDNSAEPYLYSDEEFIDGERHLYSFTITPEGNKKVYIDKKLQSSHQWTRNGMDPTENIFIWARYDISSSRFFGWYLDDIRIYGWAIEHQDIKDLYNNFDTRKPTAEIEYTPTTITTNQNIVAQVTNFSETEVSITNNGWLDYYTFTENWSFTFEFIDVAGNTWEATATVDRIDKTKPTATIEYNPEDQGWWQKTPWNVTSTLTGFSEWNITITNNNGSGIYIFTENWNFTFEFEDEVGNTGESIATVDRIDKMMPTIISTNPTSWESNIKTNQDIIIEFSYPMNTSSVENLWVIEFSPALSSKSYNRSSWDTILNITHNDMLYNTWYNITINTWAQSKSWSNMFETYNTSFTTIENIYLEFNNNLFNESLDNDGSITWNIIITLTWDIFSTWVVTSWYINTGNIPAWLTANFSRDSDTQITMTIAWNATSHDDANDINNINVSFTDDAFVNYNSWQVQVSRKSDIQIDFLDPYQQIQIIPTHDNLLDADTEPANGCDDWMCQEANYGELDYGWCSDFWSVQIMKFDLSDIWSWSQIYNATFKMTKMDRDIGTWFEIKQIINNPGWIEGVWDQAWAWVEKALTWESNYKQRKRNEEDWNNWNPWFIQWSDHKNDNIIVDPYFNTQWDETKTFDLNNTWVVMLQERLDDASTNEWFAMMNSNVDWIIIRTSEYATTTERPLLTINYIPDQTKPTIISTTPPDNAIDISTTTNLSVEFSEKIFANTWYNIYIKKTVDDSTIQTIDASSSSINIDNNALTVVIDPIDFESNVGYYILIDSWAFQDTSTNTFTGISDKTFWNFTTIDTNNIPKLSTTYYTDLTSTSATMWGTIDSAWSGDITERGIYRSLINWFSDWAGTKISNIWSRTSTGLFILPVDWFSSGTNIYFKAFAVNSYGTWYSTTQWSFITKPDTPIIDITDTSNKSFRVNRDNIIWTDSYELYIATDVWFTSLATGYAPMTGITTNTYLADWLEVQTNYFAKLVAINSGWSSYDSNIVNTTTTFTPTPTAHLKFEESVWSIAYDSASTHDWILEWDPLKLQTWAADDYAYNFDWVDDALSIVDFNYGPELSIYFRIKQSSAWDDEFIFSHGAETDPNSINIYFNDTNQKLITSINWNTGAIAITWDNYTWLLDDERHLYVLTLDYWTITGKIQSKIYLDWSLAVEDSSIDAPTNFNPNTNIVLWRRWVNTAWTYYNGAIDDFRMYNQYLLESEVNQLYVSTLDSIPPTATVDYSPGSWEQTTSNVIATLTWFSESGVVITNNLWQNTYTFIENGNFTFEFRDAAGNTWETTATVTWIVTGTLDIWVPSEFTFSGSIRSRDYDQILTWQYTWSDYFYIDDQLWLDRWRYTTISATALTWDNYGDNITNDNLFIKTNWIQKLSWDDNSLVEINNILNNYTPLSGQLNYIFRNTATNNLKRWKYGDQPYLKINFPAFKPADDYRGQLIFTIYEN